MKIIYTNMSLDYFLRPELDKSSMRFERLKRSRWYDPLPKKIIDKIYREIDGIYYFDSGDGLIASHTLRDIADKLDELNKGWPKNRSISI